MTAPTSTNAGHDEWLDAIAADEGYYLECSSGHGSLPPRRACPVCGARDIEQQQLPATGTIVTHTTVHVPTPEFDGEAPYVTVIAEFGPVRLTGLLRGTNPDAVARGQAVLPSVEEAADGRRRLRFEVVAE
jgi:uncharacterized OB-fold protein